MEAETSTQEVVKQVKNLPILMVRFHFAKVKVGEQVIFEIQNKLTSEWKTFQKTTRFSNQLYQMFDAPCS